MPGQLARSPLATLTVGANGVTATVAAPVRGWRGGAVLALASGLLLAAAFPKLDLEPLAFVGLVPLLLAIEDVAPRQAFALGWLAGFAFYLATVYWIVHTISAYSAVPFPIAVGILFLMAGVLACYVGAFAMGLRWLEGRGVPTLWVGAALWITLEWLRGWFFIGFPWASLGYSQYRFHDLVQVAELTGVYGVSALIVFFNLVTAAVLRARGRGLRQPALALGLLTALMVGLPLAGRWRAQNIALQSYEGGLRVALVQGNIEQDHKWDPAYQRETLTRYRQLTESIVASAPDLVVWPETATPFYFQQAGPLHDEIVELARSHRVALLFGSPAFQQDDRGVLRALNRAYLIAPDGRELATYDKIQLVPFGEYVPFQRVFFFVSRLVVAVGDMDPGDAQTVFEIPGGRFGVLICYEGVFPAFTRGFVAGGANFLVNITNDAWFGPSSAPYQHLAQVTFRAIENRVPVVRAANTGISAVIDPDGRIRWRGPLYDTAAHVERIAWPGVRTFYTRYGDVFVWAAALATLVAFGYGAARRN